MQYVCVFPRSRAATDSYVGNRRCKHMQEGKQKALFALGRVSVRKISSGSQEEKNGSES